MAQKTQGAGLWDRDGGEPGGDGDGHVPDPAEKAIFHGFLRGFLGNKASR